MDDGSWKNLIFAVLLSCLDSGFSHGYNLMCCRATKKAVEDWLITHGIEPEYTGTNDTYIFSVDYISSSYFTIIDSCYPLGATIGSLFIIKMANKFGRRGGMQMAAFISIFASLFIGYSKFYEMPFFLLFGRLLIGVKQGINSGLGPMYLYEISPMGKRTKIAMMYGCTVSLGMIVGKMMAKNLNSNTYWPLIMGLNVIPAFIILLLFQMCPESPKFLRVVKNNERECKKSLKWLRGENYNEDELDIFRREYYQRQTMGNLPIKFIIRQPILREALITSTIICWSQNLCGVAMMLIFIKGYLKKSHSVNVLNSLVDLPSLTKVGSILISFAIVKQISTKRFYFLTFTGMGFSSSFICILLHLPDFQTKEYMLFLTSLFYLSMYKLSTGMLSWFAPSIYFNTSSAPLGYCIGAGGNWFIKTCIFLFYVPFSRLLGGYSFLNYMVINVALAYYTYTKIHDTRKKPLTDVYKDIFVSMKKTNYKV